MDDTKIVSSMNMIECVQTFYPKTTNILTHKHNSFATFSDSDHYPFYYVFFLDYTDQKLADQKLEQIVCWAQNNFNNRWVLNIESMYESLVTEFGIHFYFKFEEDLMAFKLKWS